MEMLGDGRGSFAGRAFEGTTKVAVKEKMASEAAHEAGGGRASMVRGTGVRATIDVTRRAEIARVTAHAGARGELRVAVRLGAGGRRGTLISDVVCVGVDRVIDGAGSVEVTRFEAEAGAGGSWWRVEEA